MYVWYVCMPVMCVYVLGGVIGMRHTIIKTAIWKELLKSDARVQDQQVLVGGLCNSREGKSN